MYLCLLKGLIRWINVNHIKVCLFYLGNMVGYPRGRKPRISISINQSNRRNMYSDFAKMSRTKSASISTSKILQNTKKYSYSHTEM